MPEVSNLEVVRIFRLERDDSKTKAFVDVALGDYIIKGLRVVEGENGLFLSMPREKSKDGKYYDTVHPKTKEARQELAELVLAAYQQE